MKVYMVMFDWSTQDDEAVEIHLFSTYEKAYNYYRQCIENEKDRNSMSWAADAFDENDEVRGDYEFEETSGNIEDEPYCEWRLVDKWDYSIHDFISLEIKEVE